MKNALSLAALVAGLWLLYSGYERQQSLAGQTGSSMASLSHKIDGDVHLTTHAKYYIAGAVLTLGGMVGLGLIKR